ncbi:DUF1622 domain-containing protein [Streptomyces griseomycini]|uniref:DUF1622 domain-containing protein n=1 Tax=Streptomyces griseomycini TaxID=66895 RepID=UPI0019AE5D05|nr:DUF1622 domain-containing protein [Streptomyces griseomycini]GGR55189.1 hypothetical protein GCM10015536_70510 [Streptomyces griseomycini]
MGFRPLRGGAAARPGTHRCSDRIRLTLRRFLALGLGFQLAGDVLRTAVAPSFTEIGQLAAIAAIRTALNFFLSREIARERAEVSADQSGQHTAASRPAEGTP